MSFAPVASLTRAQARRLLVAGQGLAPPYSLPARPESVLAVLDRLGSLQFDPLSSPGARNHDLVLHARIDGYRVGWCERWLYGEGERCLFEAYNKSLNILPLSELRWHRHAWERARTRYEERIFVRHADTVKAVLEALRARGPSSTDAMAREFGQSIPWHWAPTSEGRAVLEALFECGLVGVARREGNRRFFDLLERLVPEHYTREPYERAAAVRHRLLSRYRAGGLLGTSGSAELWVGLAEASERRAALEALCREGELLPVEVEGVKGPRFVPARDADLLREVEAKKLVRMPPAVTLLAPLDPLLWDRRLLSQLFAFDYTWEVYTPVEKRRFGYYVLPILWGDALVGRIEPVHARAKATLTVQGLWLEPGFALTEPGFARALGAALERLRALSGAKELLFARRKGPQALRAALAG